MKSAKKLSEKKMSGDEKQHSVVTLVYFVFHWNYLMREEITNKKTTKVKKTARPSISPCCCKPSAAADGLPRIFSNTKLPPDQ
jgi:hypothetical protein